MTEKKKDEDWMTKKWRPMMAIMYMFCCLADFFIFPIMFTVVQFWETQAANDAFRQWTPITLQGGGLFHVAMGAVLGVSAYGRTQEKLNGATATNTTVPAGLPTTAPVPQTATVPVSSTGSATAAQTVRVEPIMVAQAPLAPPEVKMINGKPAPQPAPQPEI